MVSAMEGFLRVFERYLGRSGSWLLTMVQHSGVLVFALGISLIVGCTATISRIVVPLLATPGSVSFVFLCFTVSTFSFCILFNYVAAATFCNQVVDADEVKQIALRGESLSIHQRERRMLDPPLRYCAPCGRYKAPREHHCRMCGRCIAKMDHHCPWINNCVNAENHRYFFLFISFLLVGCGVVTAVFFFAFNFSSQVTSRNGRSYLRLFPVVSVMLLCGSIFVVMLFFVGWTAMRLALNETQIEWLILREKCRQPRRGNRAPIRNPYDLGRWWNLLNVFETRGDPLISQLKNGGRMANTCLLLWLILPTLRRSTCDGVHYPTFDYEITLLV